uniref:helix-turn-helix domain-containing protein n=1 Tax=Salipiger aestuarii TaxID=568098 RepID=UPI00123BA4C1|nr:helix-turn-helix domain-containing protein [Salipiger aestuarii]
MVIYWRESALGAVRAQLSVKEHVQLERWKPAKTPGREMARVLQRSNATIYREITRDWFSDACLRGHDGDHGGAAHQKAIDQRARQPKLIRYPLLRNRVVERIRNGWTPGQIGNRPIQEGAKLRLCQETICRYVSSKQGMAQKLWWYLPEHRKRRAPEFDRDISTLNRPDNDAHRREFGHREGDFMLVKQSPGQARHLSGRTCQPLHRAAEEREQAHKTGHDRDGDAGFCSWPHLQAQLGTRFCDPSSPWQKGSVENTNRRLRRWLARPRDVAAMTELALKQRCEQLNNTPRNCRGWRTPAEVFREKMIEETGRRLCRRR